MAPVMLLAFSTALPPGGSGALPPNRTILVPGDTLPDNSDAYGALALSYDGSLVVFAAYAAAVGAPVASAVRGLRAVALARLAHVREGRDAREGALAALVFAKLGHAAGEGRLAHRGAAHAASDAARAGTGRDARTVSQSVATQPPLP